jgi:predicted transglutaminase-like cysteine proteinase
MLTPTAAAPFRPTPASFHHPDFATPVTFAAIARPASDEAATADTTALMAAAIHADAGSQAVRNATAQATAGARRNTPAQLAAIFQWIRAHVQFVEDRQLAQGIPAAKLRALGAVPEETEVLIRPADLLTMPRPRGDCDDFAMLTAAMLRAAGIDSHLQTIEQDPEMPAQYSHIFAVAHTPTGDVPMDTSHGTAPGWSARPRPGGKSRRWSTDPMIRRKDRRRTLGDFSTDLSTYDPFAGAGTTQTNLTPWITSSAPIPIPATTTFVSSAPSIWESIIPAVVRDFSKAGASALQMSQTPTGYYQQTGPNGSITYRQPSGTSALSIPGLANASSSGLILLIVGGAVLFLFIARSKN